MALPKKYFSMEQVGNDVAIEIYGDIVEWPWLESDTSAYGLVQTIKELSDVDTITVGINSYGGEVKEGLAIYNALKQSPAKVTTRCDGFACSAASIVFCAGDERIMNDSSLLMIHNAWSYAEGDANALRKQADDLEKITEPSIRAYLSVSNLDEEEVREMMDAETWIDPDEALEMGFATSVVKSKTEKASQSVRRKVFELLKQAEDEDDAEEDPDAQEPDGTDVNTDEPADEPEPTEEPGDEDPDDEEKQLCQFLTAIFNQ